MVDIEAASTKICTKCGKSKPATDEYFHPHKGNKDGLRGCCRACHEEYLREYRRMNKETISEKNQKYYRVNKEVVIEKGYKYRRMNKETISEKNQKYYRVNKEVVIARGREYRQAHPDTTKINNNRRRARKIGLPDTFTHEQWIACLEHFNYCCAVCGYQLRDLFGNVIPHADHWIPLSNPECPGTVAENMVCLCNSCNSSKRDKKGYEWLKKRYGTRKANEILARIEMYFEQVRLAQVS